MQTVRAKKVNNVINFLKICTEIRMNGIIETKGKEF